MDQGPPHTDQRKTLPQATRGGQWIMQWIRRQHSRVRDEGSTDRTTPTRHTSVAIKYRYERSRSPLRPSRSVTPHATSACAKYQASRSANSSMPRLCRAWLALHKLTSRT